MSDAEVFLWPLLAVLSLGALASAWQARNPAKEIAARSRLIEHDPLAPTWKRMPLWRTYRGPQDDINRFASAARRRSLVLGGGAALVVLALLRGA